MRTTFELADVVRLFGAELVAKTRLTPLQLKVLEKIAVCRTAALGGHEEACENCGTLRYSYNSCGDRHCPKCQAAKQAFWIDDLVRTTLPVKHYHLVFTVPHHLNTVCLHNQRMYYDLLFAAVWQTLRSFGYSHFGVETGAVAVLHSCYSDVGIIPGDKTFRCIPTSIALFPLPGIRWMDGGKTSGMRDSTSIRFTN